MSATTRERMYIVNWNNQETVVKATWKGEAVMKVLGLLRNEFGYHHEDQDNWTCFESIKGKAWVKLHKVRVPYGLTYVAHLGYREVYKKFFKTRANTQNGLLRSESLYSNKFKHEMSLMGIDWTSIVSTVHYIEQEG